MRKGILNKKGSVRKEESTASVARGLSSYIDSLAGGAMENATMEVMPMGVSFLSPFPDFFAFGIVMLLTGVLSLGVKESTILNNLFTGLNIVTVLIVIIAGSLKADAGNWRLVRARGAPPTRPWWARAASCLRRGGRHGGAAKCFYGFVGFDCVATTGEEAKNPQKSIPLAIVVSLVIIFLAYFGISTVLTLMCPYYMQDEKAPLPYVFTQVGWPVIKWIVTTGAVFALCTSLLGAMFPLPRILYAMATDGLLFAWLARIHPRSKTPMLATVASGLLAAIMATIFDVNQLIDMMSIGTLLAYTIVAICVLILRYEEPSYAPSVSGRRPRGAADVLLWALGHLGNLSGAKTPSATSARITKWAICVYTLLWAGVRRGDAHCESHGRAGDARGVLPRWSWWARWCCSRSSCGAAPVLAPSSLQGYYMSMSSKHLFFSNHWFNQGLTTANVYKSLRIKVNYTFFVEESWCNSK
ncbi:High affinity cationic amino acid transporter 1, partial [Gryllus bimaculatus]